MSLKASQLSKSVFKVQTDQLGNQSALLKDIKDNTSSISISANNPSGVKTPLKCDANGQLEISATFSGDSMLIKGEDAAGNPKGILTDAAGHLQVDILSGTGDATAALQTTGNGSLASIATNTTGLNNCVSGNELQVDIVSGASDATAALQTTGNGSLASIATNTTGLNNCVSGSELQVDIVSGASDATAANQATIISNQTDGSQQVKMMSKNDAGANVQVKSDNSGNLAVFAADNLPIFPANTLNGEHGSHTQSIATMLRARQTISDETSGAFLLCDSAGHLQVDVVSGGGGDASETTLSALNNKVITDAGLFSARFTNEALSGNSSSSNLTIDLGANHGYKTVKYYFSLSGANVAVGSRLHLQISADGTNWIYLGSNFSVVNVSDNASGSTFAVGNARTDEPPRYIRVYNNDLQTTTINEIYYIAQKH